VKGKKMKRRIYCLAVVFSLGWVPGYAAAEIYQWVDKDGVHHFTNEPPPPGARIIDSTSEIQSDKSSADADATAPPATAPAGAETSESDSSPPPPAEYGTTTTAPAPEQEDANVDEDNGAYDDVVVREPRLRRREEISREAEREPLRQEYREEAQRDDIRREADIEERRRQPAERRRLR
jgi:hypothetical protein